MVKDGEHDGPIETRVFDSERLFHQRVRRGYIKQRQPHQKPGARESAGKIVLVDLHASDGGFAEWRNYHWEPMVEGGVPPSVAAKVGAARYGAVAIPSPFALIRGLVNRGEQEFKQLV